MSLTLEALVRSKIIPSELCVGQNSRRIEFSPSISCLPGLYSVIDVAYILLYFNIIVICRKTERTFKESFGYKWSNGLKTNVIVCFQFLNL